ncbi:MAG: Efflux ABC transporter, ATP-binding protein [uncultured Nocardioidaceae bacterium]|uniref:Efflux ABC transporter, ATP-binding protein n=1 Tax=uncultured Nocardioidaceae bacterium TaxID=253824 RepID=A0A6J4N0L2_9ACTN|nr:MAG: Efflux ABC transporter, ATP-binding protein [uncultured Nocardioidaceae bacterium]
MAELVIETADLRKEYRSRRGRLVAVKGLSLQVPRGGVHGFLGPNGSGKTTTIRMLLGLARASSGQMRLFDQEVPQHLSAVIRRVGAIVEQPKFMPGFSGHRNLTLLARTIGQGGPKVDEVIKRVGLAGREQDRYRSYSLGMKQRLAIAGALLKDPELLILDEPTNGLDPAGIREIRETIRALGESGVTVLLSSHILAEVQQVCDGVSIIGHGTLLASGSVADVVGGRGGGVRLGLADLAAGADVLTQEGYAVRRDGDRLLVDTDADPAALTEHLAGAGLYVSEIGKVQADLETVFLELTDADEGSVL